VEREIQRRIAAAEKAKTSTAWFPKLMPSIHDVWETLTEKERAEVGKETERLNREGLPLEAKAK